MPVQIAQCFSPTGWKKNILVNRRHRFVYANEYSCYSDYVSVHGKLSIG